MVSKEEILAQSKAAYGQWCVQWRENAITHSKYPMKSFNDFENTGMGKAILCVANGYSLEENMETIRKYADNIDILCCDKSLGHLLKNGIKPKYCLVCDANVPFEKYLEEYQYELSETILIQNVSGNPKWTACDWKDRYFFVNKDVLESEKEFMALSGCNNQIPAATNVSNAMVVAVTQSDNETGPRNLFGYDKILLIGYDYCWREFGNYYAYDKTGNGKHSYMRHIFAFDLAGNDVYTSGNLMFSSRWFSEYVKAFNLPVVQCSKTTIVSLPRVCDLESQLKYRYKADDSITIRALSRKVREMKEEMKKITDQVATIKNDHALKFLQTV